MSANYDITIDQGSSFYFHFQYLDENSNPINVAGYTAEMMVKRSSLLDESILHLTNARPNGGITAGFTGATFGLTGGISLNRNLGNTGSQTGGILVIAGSTATGFIPAGFHDYDIEFLDPAGVKTRVLRGRFNCDGEVTK